LLKISLQKSSRLDRDLEAASKGMASLIEAGMDYGLLKIVAYPNLDPVIAASLVASYLISIGVRPSYRVSYSPPSSVSGPTLLLGYPSLNYDVGDIGDKLLAVSYEDMLGQPPLGAVYVESTGSISAALSLILSTTSWGLRDEQRLKALIGTYASKYVDSIGKIHGIDSILVESMEPAGLTMVTTVKSYKPSELELCSALSITLDPFYPDITGDEDFCRKMLEAAGIGSLVEKKPESLKPEELGKLSKALIEHASRYSRRDLDPADFFGGILVSTNTPPSDPRMSAHAILAGIESIGDPSVALAAMVDFESEYEVLESRISAAAKVYGEEVSSAKPRRHKGPNWLRIYQVNEGKVRSPTLLYRTFVLLGIIEKESVIVFERGGETMASPFQVEEALGYGSLGKLVDAKLAEPDEFMIRMRLGSSR